ncbi:unnamed protein product [Durusdinium trenchii]|uniref:ABC transmembrane type-1 domain-containing protein n=1 Tax=Durusdinium trenchii TaxID=1381693 RepID=A0ABP0P4G4_9DINO
MGRKRDEEEMTMWPVQIGNEEARHEEVVSSMEVGALAKVDHDIEKGFLKSESIEPSRSVLGAAAMLARMFYRDASLGRRAVVLSISVFALLLLEIGAVLYYSGVQKNYMTALQEKNVEAFYHGLWMVAAVCRALRHVLIVFISPIIALHEYTSGLLKVTFRESLTRRFCGIYLAAPGYAEGAPFYRAVARIDALVTNKMQLNLFSLLTITGEIDNPDQRICQDVSDFVGIAVHLVQDVVRTDENRSAESGVGRTFLNIFGFATVLYSISPAACFGVLIYSVTGTLIATRGFGPWIGFYQLQRVKQEANLRYDLIRVRENAESVAFFEGGTAEWSKFSTLFNDLLTTVYRSVVVASGFGMFNRSFHWASMAFNIILGALTLIMDKLESLTDVAVRIRRLEDLELALRRCKNEADRPPRKAPKDLEWFGVPELRSVEDNAESGADELLRFREALSVTLRTPPRQGMLQQTLCQELSMELKDGALDEEHDLHCIGKSSLLRAAAGLWADGCGEVQLCQRRTAPRRAERVCRERDSLLGDVDIQQALKQVNLHHLLEPRIQGQKGFMRQEVEISSCEQTGGWLMLMSLGQQQRINFARVLLRPETRVALIDEGTSACDPGNEALLYGLLRERLSGFFDAESGAIDPPCSSSIAMCRLDADENPPVGSADRLYLHRPGELSHEPTRIDFMTMEDRELTEQKLEIRGSLTNWNPKLRVSVPNETLRSPPSRAKLGLLKNHGQLIGYSRFLTQAAATYASSAAVLETCFEGEGRSRLKQLDSDGRDGVVIGQSMMNGDSLGGGNLDFDLESVGNTSATYQADADTYVALHTCDPYPTLNETCATLRALASGWQGLLVQEVWHQWGTPDIWPFPVLSVEHQTGKLRFRTVVGELSSLGSSLWSWIGSLWSWIFMYAFAYTFLALGILNLIGFAVHDLTLLSRRNQNYILDLPAFNQGFPYFKKFAMLSGIPILPKLFSIEGTGRTLAIAIGIILAPFIVVWAILFLVVIITPCMVLLFFRYPVRLSRFAVFLTLLATSIFGLTMTIIPPLWQHTSTCSDGENDAFTMAAATGPYEGLVYLGNLNERPRYALVYQIQNYSPGECYCGCSYFINAASLIRISAIGAGVTFSSCLSAFRCLKGLRRAQWANLMPHRFPVPVTVYSVFWTTPNGDPIQHRKDVDAAGRWKPLGDRVMDGPKLPELKKGEFFKQPTEVIGCCGFPCLTGGYQVESRAERAMAMAVGCAFPRTTKMEGTLRGTQQMEVDGT